MKCEIDQTERHQISTIIRVDLNIFQMTRSLHVQSVRFTVLQFFLLITQRDGVLNVSIKTSNIPTSLSLPSSPNLFPPTVNFSDQISDMKVSEFYDKLSLKSYFDHDQC